MSDSVRETKVKECGLPYLIIKCGSLEDSPGGVSKLVVSPETPDDSVISREDVGWVVAASEDMTCTTKAVVQVGCR